MLFAYKPCLLAQDIDNFSHVQWDIKTYPIYQTVHSQRGELVLQSNNHQHFSSINITLLPYPSGDDLSITFSGNFDFNQVCKKLSYYRPEVSTEGKALNITISKNERKLDRLFKQIDKIIPLQIEMNLLKMIYCYINETCFLQSFTGFAQSFQQRTQRIPYRMVGFVSAFTRLS